MRVEMKTVFEDVDELAVEEYLVRMKKCEGFRGVSERLLRGQTASFTKHDPQAGIVTTTIKVLKEKIGEETNG